MTAQVNKLKQKMDDYLNTMKLCGKTPTAFRLTAKNIKAIEDQLKKDAKKAKKPDSHIKAIVFSEYRGIPVIPV
jgi:hypothetical protein